MTVTMKVHHVREIVRANLSGNRLKSFVPLPSPGSGSYILHLLHHPFKVVLKVVDDERMRKQNVERAVQRILGEVDGVRVPEVINLDDSRALVPFRYYLRTHIPGLQWGDVMSLLSTSDRVSLARRCGEMMGAFHSVESDRCGEIGGRLDSPSWSSTILDRAMEHLGRVMDKGWIGSGEGRDVSERLLDSRNQLDLDSRAQLTHRRLTPADILVKNEGGEWIATGILGVGRSAMWHHLWDMASLARQIGDDHPDMLRAFEDSHYGIISRPDAYGERLEVYMILEALDCLGRADEDEENIEKLVGRII